MPKVHSACFGGPRPVFGASACNRPMLGRCIIGIDHPLLSSSDAGQPAGHRPKGFPVVGRPLAKLDGASQILKLELSALPPQEHAVGTLSPLGAGKPVGVGHTEGCDLPLKQGPGQSIQFISF